ncbi:MAG: KpsF/GutQ family sugar-phosphate isomerase [Candidatus Zophobacter franzmannii]|nr:KpsF/GutQ family sugar-phosphate isomerase [Candidatus Zophobacter franzmannii]
MAIWDNLPCESGANKHRKQTAMTKKNPEPFDISQARDIICRESQALGQLADLLDQSFIDALQMIYQCRGAVVLTGIGKAGIIGQKISGTLASTGTPSHFLHAAEAIHGDLGRLRSEDIAVVLSYSGSSEEIVRLIALLKKQAVPMIAITGDKQSPLAKHSDVTLWLGNIEEVCPLGIAPSTSTTCMLAMGDALALSVMQMRNFQPEDYARYHPGGALGRQLITVEQAALFNRDKKLPIASQNCTVQQALQKAESEAALRHGCILLTDANDKLSGILTDGDLRRGLESQGAQLHSTAVSKIMTRNPKTVRPDTLASEAMAIFHKNRIDEIPVVDHNHKPVGLIDVQDVVALKIVQ